MKKKIKYDIHRKKDQSLRRYNGDKVVKVLYGKMMIHGAVVRGETRQRRGEENSAQEFLVHYRDLPGLQEWVSDFEVRVMKSWWKKHKAAVENIRDDEGRENLSYGNIPAGAAIP